MRSLPCKTCGAEARRRFALPNPYGGPPWLDLFVCRACGLLFVGTPLGPEQLAAAYDAIDSDALYARAEATLLRKVDRALDALAPKLVPGARLLDVGCGHGLLLRRLAARFPTVRAAGHELPGRRAERCRAAGLTVHTGPLGAIPERFDAAALLDVAEHVPDPNRLFADLRRLLVDDGRLHLHTPRRCAWDSLALALVGVPGLGRAARRWLALRVSIFHLQLWTDRALCGALERAGFEARLEAVPELSFPVDLYLQGVGLPRPARAVLGGLAGRALGRLHNKAVVEARPRAARAARRWVITVNYHGEAQVRRNAAALRARGVGLVVVDNSGTYPRPLTQAELLVTGHGNPGWAAGNNLGVRALAAREELTDDDLLFFVNPDVAIDASAAAFVAAVEPSPDALLYVETPGVRTVRFHPALGVATTLPLGQEVFRGCFCALRYGALRRVGPFSEGYFLYGEEVDFALRARAAGLRVERAVGVSAAHAQGAAAREAGAFPRLYFQARVLNFRRFARHPRAGLPVLGASLLAMAARHARTPRGLRQAWDGVRAGLRADLAAFAPPAPFPTPRPGSQARSHG